MSTLQSRILALVPMDDADAVDPMAIVGAAVQVRGQSAAIVHAVILGREPEEAQGRQALLAGADRVTLASHAGLAVPPQAEQLLAAFSSVLSALDMAGGAPALVLLPAGSIGEELASRLAVRHGGGALGRCTHIELTSDGVVAHRPAYAGRAQVALTPVDTLLFAAMRGSGEQDGASTCDAARPNKLVLDDELPVLDVSYAETGQKMVRLEAAKIIVSGGRGMGGAEGFELLDRLAILMGGSLGGSLPTVDAGWVPVSRQVGQSGKYVTPELYIAVGISGTPQHLAGIGLNSRIVAINSDAGADIFNVAEIGIVADWRAVVPALIEVMNEERSQSD